MRIEYFKQLRYDREITKSLLIFHDGEQKENYLGETLVDIAGFDYEAALHDINRIKSDTLKLINPKLTIKKAEKFIVKNRYSSEKLINFLKFPEVKSSEYFKKIYLKIKKELEKSSKLNSYYIHYLKLFKERFKDIEVKNALGLLEYLEFFENIINYDKIISLKYLTAMDFVFDENTQNTSLKDLPPRIRYLIYLGQNDIADKVELRELRHHDTIERKINPNIKDVKFKDYDYALRESYIVVDTETALYLEFRYLLQSNKTLKKCDNCKKYFIAIDRNKNLSLCDREFLNTGKTCQTVGNINKLKKKLQESEALALRQKVYKRNRKRYETGKLTDTEFNEWLKYSKELAEKTDKGEFPFPEFEKIMDYKPEEIRIWLNEMRKESIDKEGER